MTSAAREQTVNVTFVGEDDVVTEMIPPPAIPVSSRKFGAYAVDTSSSDESVSDDLNLLKDIAWYQWKVSGSL